MMTPLDREWLAGLCATRAGLNVDPDKAYLMENRLAPVARREGFGSLGEFAEAIRHRGEERLIWMAVEAMSHSETSFFREPQVLERVVRDIVPALARTDRPLRIWSAACGAGQEIYSLTMRLVDHGLAGGADILASDLSERRLEKAQAGFYSQLEVQRGLPAWSLVRHFGKEGEAFVLSARLRQDVRWRRVNLLEDVSRHGTFDLIVFRNVLSSLTHEGRRQAMTALVSAMAPGGRLVVGMGETPEGVRPVSPGIFAAPEDGLRVAA